MSLNKFTSFDRGEPVDMQINANQLKLNDAVQYPVGTFLKVGSGGVIEGVQESLSERNVYEATTVHTIPLTTAGTYFSMLPAFGFSGSNTFSPASLQNGDRIEFNCCGIYTTTTSPSPGLGQQGADFKLILSQGDESVKYENLFTAVTDNKGLLLSAARANTRRMFEMKVILHKRINNGGASLNFQVVTYFKTSSWYGIVQSGSNSYPSELSAVEVENITIPYSNTTQWRFEPQVASTNSSSSNPDFTMFVQRSTIRQYSGGGYPI